MPARRYTQTPVLNAISSAEQYHLESAMSRTSKKFSSGYEANYGQEVQKMIAEGSESESSLSDIALDPFLDMAHNEKDSRISMTVEECIVQRTSVREFGQRPLPLTRLAQLLYLANGVRRTKEPTPHAAFNRNVPSSGGLASVEIYAFMLNVDNVEPGIYRFDARTRSLDLIKKGDFAQWIRRFAIQQVEFAEAGCVLILTVDLAKLSKKYGIRAYRLALMDAGHVSQNIYLAATALNLAVCATAGFVDCEVNHALGLDGLDRSAVLAAAVAMPVPAETSRSKDRLTNS